MTHRPFKILLKYKYLGYEEIQYYYLYPSENSRKQDNKSKWDMMAENPWFISTELKQD